MPTNMTEVKMPGNTKCCWGCEASSSIHYGNSGSVSQNRNIHLPRDSAIPSLYWPKMNENMCPHNFIKLVKNKKWLKCPSTNGEKKYNYSWIKMNTIVIQTKWISLKTKSKERSQAFIWNARKGRTIAIGNTSVFACSWKSETGL